MAEEQRAAAAPAAPAEPDDAAELAQFAQLKNQGILTEKELAAKKQQILGVRAQCSLMWTSTAAEPDTGRAFPRAGPPAGRRLVVRGERPRAVGEGMVVR